MWAALNELALVVHSSSVGTGTGRVGKKTMLFALARKGQQIDYAVRLRQVASVNTSCIIEGSEPVELVQ